MASVQVTLLEPKLLRERGRRERVVIEEDEMILHVKIWKHLQNRMDSLYSSCMSVKMQRILIFTCPVLFFSFHRLIAIKGHSASHLVTNTTT